MRERERGCNLEDKKGNYELRVRKGRGGEGEKDRGKRGREDDR